MSLLSIHHFSTDIKKKTISGGVRSNTLKSIDTKNSTDKSPVLSKKNGDGIKTLRVKKLFDSILDYRSNDNSGEKKKTSQKNQLVKKNGSKGLLVKRTSIEKKIIGRLRVKHHLNRVAKEHKTRFISNASTTLSIEESSDTEEEEVVVKKSKSSYYNKNTVPTNEDGSPINKLDEKKAAILEELEFIESASNGYVPIEFKVLAPKTSKKKSYFGRLDSSIWKTIPHNISEPVEIPISANDLYTTDSIKRLVAKSNRFSLNSNNRSVSKKKILSENRPSKYKSMLETLNLFNSRPNHIDENMANNNHSTSMLDSDLTSTDEIDYISPSSDLVSELSELIEDFDEFDPEEGEMKQNDLKSLDDISPEDIKFSKKLEKFLQSPRANAILNQDLFTPQPDRFYDIVGVSEHMDGIATLNEFKSLNKELWESATDEEKVFYLLTVLTESERQELVSETTKLNDLEEEIVNSFFSSNKDGKLGNLHMALQKQIEKMGKVGKAFHIMDHVYKKFESDGYFNPYIEPVFAMRRAMPILGIKNVLTGGGTRSNVQASILTETKSNSIVCKWVIEGSKKHKNEGKDRTANNIYTELVTMMGHDTSNSNASIKRDELYTTIWPIFALDQLDDEVESDDEVVEELNEDNVDKN